MARLTRREFLRISAFSATATVMAACAVPSEAPGEPTVAPAAPTSAPPIAPPEAVSKFEEAPVLAEKVASGELPPVDERLPEDPAVIPVYESTGQYGGTIRRGFKGPSDHWGPNRWTIRGLNVYTSDYGVRPEIASSWEINEDASQWTCHLRKGMKWSDGAPFTSADFRFWYDHVLMNEELTPALPGWPTWFTRFEGEKVAMQVETPDDFTLVFNFAHPYPLFHYTAIYGYPYEPAHYMRQFHMDLTEDKAGLEAAMADSNVATWMDYFREKQNWQINIEKPVTCQWVPVTALNTEMYVMERNPYNHAVDPEGRQLPYVDKTVHRLFETPDVFNMWIIGGEIDCQMRHVSFANYTLFKESEADGDYTVLRGIAGGTVGITPNLTTQEPRVREFFQDRNVRIALSLAVNRDELNEVVYDGLMVPSQSGIVSTGELFEERYRNNHIEYDPDEANRLLDEAGYDQRDAGGLRMWKDGSGTLSFVIEGTAQPGTQGEDAMQVIVKYLEDVGVKAAYKYVERSLYTEHFQSNIIECSTWAQGRVFTPHILMEPYELLGTQLDRPWACAWGIWKSDPDDPNAEEPPEGHWIRDIWALYDQAAVEPDDAKRVDLFKQMLDIHAEQIPMIGYLAEAPGCAIRKNGLHNYELVGETYTRSYNGTYYWDEPEEHV